MAQKRTAVEAILDILQPELEELTRDRAADLVLQVPGASDLVIGIRRVLGGDSFGRVMKGAFGLANLNDIDSVVAWVGSDPNRAKVISVLDEMTNEIGVSLKNRIGGMSDEELEEFLQNQITARLVGQMKWFFGIGGVVMSNAIVDTTVVPNRWYHEDCPSGQVVLNRRVPAGGGGGRGRGGQQQMIRDPGVVRVPWDQHAIVGGNIHDNGSHCCENLRAAEQQAAANAAQTAPQQAAAVPNDPSRTIPGLLAEFADDRDRQVFVNWYMALMDVDRQDVICARASGALTADMMLRILAQRENLHMALIRSLLPVAPAAPARQVSPARQLFEQIRVKPQGNPARTGAAANAALGLLAGIINPK